LKKKEQLKEWMHTHSQRKTEKNKRCLPAGDNCCLGHEKIVDIGINAARDHSNVRIVLRCTEKYSLGLVIQKKKR
jgi:hypothetical protein